MPSYTHWFNDEKTIIIHEVIGSWRIDDFFQEMYEAKDILNTDKYHPRYFIVDFTEAKGMPSGILSYQTQYEQLVDDESMTWVVGAHPMIKFFAETFKRLGLKIAPVFVDSLDEALADIEAYQNQ